MSQALPGGAFLISLVAVALATPVAIRVARRTGFHDHPVGYKGHAAPTPYLGGGAVVLGLVVALLLFGGDLSRLAAVAGGATLLWAVGTADDRLGLSPSRRVLAEIVAATILWSAGGGWSLSGNDAIDLLLTCLWIVGVVNAFNLMDNMDGAATTVALVSGASIGVLALLEDDLVAAALAFSIAGACAGFLPYNLAGPARIFLGDGGSMPLGFLVAAAMMLTPVEQAVGWPALLTAALIVGLPALDTALVIVSRRRRGVPVLSGGRDHLTHRLRTRLPSPRFVALALALLQASLCGMAIGATELGALAVVTCASVLLLAGATAVVVLETPAWHSASARGGRR